MAESSIITTNAGAWKGRIFVIALLLALAGEIFLLTSDFSFFRQGGASADLAPVAELVSRFNQVKGQLPGEVVWDDAKDGQVLYRRQYLMTLDQAKAEIAFLDGSGLVLDENTLVQLEKSPGNDSRQYRRLIVRLLRGKIHKLRSPNPPKHAPIIEIDVGDTASTLAPDSEVTVSASPEGPVSAEFRVRSGEIRIAGIQGELAVSKGEEAEIPRSAPGAPVSRRMNFDLRSPSSSQTLEADGERAEVRFAWSMAPSAVAGNPVELEVSTNAEFNPTKAEIFRKRIPASEPPLDQVETKLDLPVLAKPTTWFWRINVSPALQSRVASFRLQTRSRPRLRFPERGAKAAPGTSIDFSWTGIEGAKGYELELTPSSGTLGEPRSVISDDPSARMDHLENGNYTWRARARFASGDPGAWTESRELFVGSSLAAPQAPPPPPDELLEPEIRPRTEVKAGPRPRHSFLEKLERVLGLTIARADELESPVNSWAIHLKWKPVPGVERYRVQVGREKSFTHLLGQKDISAPEWSWTYRLGMENRKGRLFYRVASIGGDGQVGAFSSPRPFRIPRWILKAEEKAKKRSGKTSLIAAPSAPVAPSPGFGTNSVRPLSFQAREERQTNFWRWNFLMDAGMGNFSEGSADPTLNSISSKTFYPQAETRLFALLTSKSDPDHPSQWAIQLEASASEFTQSSGRAALALNLLEWTGKLDVLRFRSERLSLGRWRWAFGGRAERDFRWIKPAVELIDVGYGYSAGPMLFLQREDEFTSIFLPTEKGLTVALPFTGIITGWQIAAESSLWAEWKFAQPREGWIGTRLEGDFSYSVWGTPTWASLLKWAVWFGPSFHFGSGYSPAAL